MATMISPTPTARIIETDSATDGHIIILDAIHCDGYAETHYAYRIERVAGRLWTRIYSTLSHPTLPTLTVTYLV